MAGRADCCKRVVAKSRSSVEHTGLWLRERTEELVAVVKEMEAVLDVAGLVKTNLTIRSMETRI